MTKKTTALLKSNEVNALKLLKNKITKQYKILNIRLYGSKARGQSTLESDIDLMIELKDHNKKIESAISDIIIDINIEYDVFISPLYFSRKTIVEGPLSESPIYKVIQREGITI